MVYKKKWTDWAFDIILFALIFFVIAVTLYPLIYVFSMSISNPQAALRGDVLFLPKGFSTKSYQVVLATKDLWTYYYNTLWYTVVGTLFNVVVTVLAAYPLSKKSFSGRNFFTVMILITMFFKGGLIPSYILVNRLGLYNTRWAIILPTLTAAWYIVITRSFFQSLPEELFESARIEGASEYRILGQIALPLSKPILAVLALYYGVGHWNSYFPETIFLSNSKLHPIQIYLRRVVIQSSPEAIQNFNMDAVGKGILDMMQVKYAVIMISILPVLLFYPFLQKYLVKGVLVGSLKG